ncbi:hypothetical protein L1987_18340 [Smallanthus sonchifolius]|uniref:Uncharacterized protein n=1 Tax=Smallanthus sonchifolius TaxID=185202 RepID=A0ACB9J2Y1_9ASTR|nr:hypothetical protein L1987_18340 [Smallanthus sonchifolius]
MGYRGRANDTRARKGGLVEQWRYFMHVIIQCLSPRKSGTDGLNTSLQSAMVALTLNRGFNFAHYFYKEIVAQINPLAGQEFPMYPGFLQMILNHLIPNLPQLQQRLTLTPMTKRIFTYCNNIKQQNPALIPVPTPLFGHLINPDYVPPPNDNWIHPEEVQQQQQSQLQATQQPQPQQVAPEEQPEQVNVKVHDAAQDNVIEPNLEVHEEVHVDVNVDQRAENENIDNEEQVHSPQANQEGQVSDTSTSSSEKANDTDSDTNSESTQDFDPDHYAKLATIPSAITGKRLKSVATKPRRKSVRGLPPGTALGK